MKCKKCGNELKITDKFCSKCGAKVEQQNITEYSNSANDIHNEHVTLTEQPKQKLNRKHIKFTIVWIVCCVAAVFAIVFAAESCTSYKKYQIKGMTFQIPSNWDVIEKEKGYYIYDTSYNLLYISGDTYDYIDDDFYNGFISGIKDKFNNCTELNRDYKNIDGVESLNFRFTYSLNETDRYMNMYLIPKNGILYEIGFGSYGLFQSPDFNSAESKILNSIDIDESYTNEQIIEEDATQHSNKKTTETQTEKPTEKPTSKATEKPTEKPKTDISTGKTNALKSAKSYLEYSAFSYQGLIDQLEYEKYSNEEAVYAVDNCGANWNEQAVKSAKSYLDYSAFSYQGLIKQLEYEKFTNSEATYGADNCGADWNEQAVKSAASYLEYSSFSKDSLINQLEYEGFTHEQAVYGAEKNGY